MVKSAQLPGAEDIVYKWKKVAVSLILSLNYHILKNGIPKYTPCSVLQPTVSELIKH